METGKQWMRRGVVAVCGLALAAGWQVYGRLIAPLKELATEARRDVTDLRGRIDGAQKTIAEIQLLEQSASGARGELQSFQADIPPGSPLVWFPPRMEKHFGRMGLSRAVTRLNTALDEPGLPDFERTYWAVELPVGNSSGEFRRACLAIAEIEPVDPSIRVLDVEIRRDANDPTRHLMVMNVAILARKADTAR